MKHATVVVLATLGFMAGTVILSIPRWRRGWLGYCLLGLYFASLASLAGCGGGEMSAEDKAQHEADVQQLNALIVLHQMTQQPVNCSNPGVCK